MCDIDSKIEASYLDIIEDLLQTIKMLEYKIRILEYKKTKDKK